MKKVLLALFMLMTPLGVVAQEETFDELLDSIESPIPPRFQNGVIREIDLAARKLQVSGYDYHVGPAFGENTTEISLYGTTFGSLELLSVGMKVQVEYMDLKRARIAMAIKELSPAEEVEH